MKIAPMEVTLIDHMGSDLTVVNAARVSFDKESEWGEVKFAQDPNDPEATVWYRPLKEGDAKLIHYLAKHNHWTPFGHCFLQFRIKAPIFVARQLVKHQVGLVWNEVSRRYVDSEPEFWFPDVWRGRPEGSMKQGSSGTIEEVQPETGPMFDIGMTVKQDVAEMVNLYNDLIYGGVAPEQARMVLPQNTMTEWYWSGSLAAFARVCKLRLDPHAQEETRFVASEIATCASPLFPISWAAILDPLI